MKGRGTSREGNNDHEEKREIEKEEIDVGSNDAIVVWVPGTFFFFGL